jgi:hypothetical protein
MKCRRMSLPFVAAVVGGFVLVAAQSDPAVGTWKLNSAKSRYNPGLPPKSQTVTITAVANGIAVVSRGVDAEGKPIATDYTATYDGKDAPVKGSRVYDTTSLKRIDASTSELTRKKAGRVIQTVRRVISADGKTMTVTTTGENEAGVRVNNVAVFERGS